MFSEKSRDFQKNESRKNFSKDNPIEVELMKNKNRQINRDVLVKKQEIFDKSKPVQRSSMSNSVGSVYNMNPTFEIFNTHTLVAKSNSAASKPTTQKTRGSLFQQHQPVIIVKPHYENNSMLLNPNIIPKLTRHPNSAQEEKRSMSAVVKSQSKPEMGYKTSLKPALPVGFKSHPRIMSATNKSTNVQNNNNNNYDSLSRSRNKNSSKISDQNNDANLQYYSLQRKPKPQAQNEGKSSSRTRPIGTLIDPSKKHKLSIETTATIATEVSDANPINFSTTLAKAATNSPPIKRRNSSLIHSPNPRMPARFASRSTINDIYTSKNYKEYQEKYKKAANEILRENLAMKFGPNASFLSQPHIESAQSRSSTSSTSSSASSTSTSSGTDQQISISSIPHDDIPLGIPSKNDINSNHKTSPVMSSKVESKQINDIVQGMVMFDDDIKKDADVVHLSDEDNDEYDEYNLDGEPSSSESYSSDSNEDIENLKKKFIPLYEIERLDDDFTIQNEMGGGLPDHQHSQSFRVENTSVASNTEVFVHKESLQRAKDALNINPHHGILSVKPLDNSENHKVKKRKAIFDPHILLLDACLEPDFELVKELVPKVPNISKKTIDGITALHNAVCSADPKLVLFLLQSGADVNASDADGWTPLHCAACCNNKQISKILVEHGASLFSITLSDFEIPSQKCNKASQEDTLCEEYLFWEQENLGVVNKGITYALFKYDAQKEDELSLVPNQILKILDTNPPGESGWFLAEDLSEIVNVPRKGFVAAAYVSVYQLIMPQKRSDLTHRS